MIACSALFLVLTTGAMVVYRGGGFYHQGADHYLFFENYFSDLGGLRTYTGGENGLSRHLFATALVLVGSSVACFGPCWRRWASGRNTTILGATATGFAALSGLGFIAIGLAPWDRYLDTHDAIVRGTFGLLAVFIVCLTAIQARNGAPRIFLGANGIYLFGLALYALLLWLGPRVGTPGGLMVQVAAQKVIVYASILDLSLQAWGARQRTR